MNQYGVRYLPEAITALREAFVYIRAAREGPRVPEGRRYIRRRASRRTDRPNASSTSHHYFPTSIQDPTHRTLQTPPDFTLLDPIESYLLDTVLVRPNPEEIVGSDLHQSPVRVPP